MAYHPLANDTGGTADDRRAEADRILKILDECGDPREYTAREDSFLGNMRENRAVSPKQLFYLRDLKVKYAE